MHASGDDPLIAHVADELRRPVAPRPGFDARIMATVRSVPPSLPRRVWAWLREPRALALSPLGGVAWATGLAALLVAGTFAVVRTSGPAAAPLAAVAPSRAPELVTFVLVAPAARSVALTGDFDGWDRTRLPMRREASGLWTLDVPLAPGRYQYAFVVDGRRFVADPGAPRAIGDDFGQPTSVVTVAAPATGGTL
jgi:Carbohydrate-binding module 48 (Isoamylase N-terminal domain)